jgi:hypothetical protein
MVFNSTVSWFNMPVNAVLDADFRIERLVQECTVDGFDRSHRSGNIFELGSSYA